MEDIGALLGTQYLMEDIGALLGTQYLMEDIFALLGTQYLMEDIGALLGTQYLMVWASKLWEFINPTNALPTILGGDYSQGRKWNLD